MTHSHKHPRLSIGPKGESLLAWAEGTGWGRGGSIAWQIYDTSGTPMVQKGAESGLPAWRFAAVVATRDRSSFFTEWRAPPMQSCSTISGE